LGSRSSKAKIIVHEKQKVTAIVRNKDCNCRLPVPADKLWKSSRLREVVKAKSKDIATSGGKDIGRGLEARKSKERLLF